MRCPAWGAPYGLHVLWLDDRPCVSCLCLVTLDCRAMGWWRLPAGGGAFPFYGDGRADGGGEL